MRTLSIAVAATGLCLALSCLPAFGQRRFEVPPVKVVILAGQSNMEGKAKMSLLEFQANDAAHRATYEHLREADQWRVRDDVWIRFHDRHGPLTVGYGSPECIGPELEFGFVVGDHFEAPVLLIKTAWGGRSLYRDFRPPSAGLPSDELLARMLEQANKNAKELLTLDDIKGTFGKSYREMLDEIHSTLNEIDTYVPGGKERGVELVGFVWFQGWNDMINDDYTAEYAANLAHFIRDVRRDLGAPQLPFVIGQMGVDGVEADSKKERFKAAQAEPASLSEFRDNVRLVKTDVFWDEDAAAVFKRGWQENLEEWNKVGSDFPYHYLGSGKTMIAIGRAFAEGMLELQSP